MESITKTIEKLSKNFDKLNLQTSEEEEDKQENDDSYYLCDLVQVLKQHLRWMKAMPRICPHYAVKCNPDENVLRLMIELGIRFDCASQHEIGLLLGLGAHPDKIIYANPCKQVSHLVYAAQKRVKKTVFDSREELEKIKTHHPNAEVLLRIKTDDSSATNQLSNKFGASIEDCRQLIKHARKIEVNLIGICFHAGSGITDSSCFEVELKNCRALFDFGKEVGYHFTCLDIGGGYPGSDKSGIKFEELFPLSAYPDVSIIAEPGRYYVTSAYTLVTRVIAKRCVHRSSEGHPVYNYHINDGLFGALSFIHWETLLHDPVYMRKVNSSLTLLTGKKYLSNLWGPTLYKTDKLLSEVLIPELEVDDIVIWNDAGGYTIACQPDEEPFTAVKYVNSLAQVLEKLKVFSSTKLSHS